MLGDGVAGDAGVGLHVDCDICHAVVFFQDDLEFVADARDFHEGLFDLPRIEVDAFDDEHIVRAAGDTVDTEGGAAAGAFFTRDDACDVVGAVADDGHGFARKRSEDHLAIFAVGQDFACDGVNDFGDILVFPDVESAMAAAVLAGCADAACFGHAINVEAFDVESVLNFLTHFVGERFRAEDADAQRGDVVITGWVGIEHFDDSRHIGDDGDEAFCMEIAHEADLAFGVAGGGWDDKELGLACAVVATEAAIEEAEGWHDLDGVAMFHSGHGVATRHTFGPLKEVVLCIGHDDGRAGGAGGHVEFHQVFAVDAIHLEWIGFAEIFLCKEREFCEVIERLHIIW